MPIPSLRRSDFAINPSLEGAERGLALLGEAQRQNDNAFGLITRLKKNRLANLLTDQQQGASEKFNLPEAETQNAFEDAQADIRLRPRAVDLSAAGTELGLEQVAADRALLPKKTSLAGLNYDQSISEQPRAAKLSGLNLDASILDTEKGLRGLEYSKAYTPPGSFVTMTDEQILDEAQRQSPQLGMTPENRKNILSDPQALEVMRNRLFEDSYGKAKTLSALGQAISGSNVVPTQQMRDEAAKAGYVYMETSPGSGRYERVPNRTVSAGQFEKRSDTDILKRARDFGIQTDGKDVAQLEKEVADAVASGRVRPILSPSEQLASKRFNRESYKENPTTIAMYGSGQMPGLFQVKSKLDAMLKPVNGDFSKLTPQQLSTFVFQFSKFNDPNSAVLLGEYAAAASRLGLEGRAELALQKAISGDPITADQAKDIYETIDASYQDVKQNHFMDLADREAILSDSKSKNPLVDLGVPKNIRDEYEAFKAGQSVDGIDGTEDGVQDETVDVSTPEEARSLPADVKYFRNPSGQIFENPNYAPSSDE